jgi:hypothetical protein
LTTRRKTITLVILGTPEGGFGRGLSDSEVDVEQAAQLGEARGVLGGMVLLKHKLEIIYGFGQWTYGVLLRWVNDLYLSTL